MNLLADESVDRQIVERLRNSGHEVRYIAEFSPGVDDTIVLREANAFHAPLLTADKDFGELVYRQQLVHEGVVLFRLAGLSPGNKAKIVADVVDTYGDDMRAVFTVISPGSVRIRRTTS